MKHLLVCFALILPVIGCSDGEKESDKMLSEYKKQQLDKAKQVEQEMQNRVDNLEQQLQDATKEEEEEEDQP